MNRKHRNAPLGRSASASSVHGLKKQVSFDAKSIPPGAEDLPSTAVATPTAAPPSVVFVSQNDGPGPLPFVPDDEDSEVGSSSDGDVTVSVPVVGLADNGSKPVFDAVAKGEEERLANEAADKAEEERLAKEAADKEAADKAEEERLAKEAADKAEEERQAKEAADEEARLAKEAIEEANSGLDGLGAADTVDESLPAADAAENAGGLVVRAPPSAGFDDFISSDNAGEPTSAASGRVDALNARLAALGLTMSDSDDEAGVTVSEQGGGGGVGLPELPSSGIAAPVTAGSPPVVTVPLDAPLSLKPGTRMFDFSDDDSGDDAPVAPVAARPSLLANLERRLAISNETSVESLPPVDGGDGDFATLPVPGVLRARARARVCVCVCVCVYVCVGSVMLCVNECVLLC